MLHSLYTPNHCLSEIEKDGIREMVQAFITNGINSFMKTDSRKHVQRYVLNQLNSRSMKY